MIRKIINEILDKQDKKGLETYGQTLDDCNYDDYDWHIMALEEAADMVQYLTKELIFLRNKVKQLEAAQSK